MDAPDSLLIAWWFFTLVLGVAGFALAKRQLEISMQAAVLAALRNGTGGRAIPVSGPALPRVIDVLAVALTLIWLAGLLALVWMAYWTNLLLLNLHVLVILLGASFLGFGLLASTNAMMSGSDPMWLPRAARRPLMILVGLIVIAFGSYLLIGDFGFPKLMVQGRVDDVSRSGLKMDGYAIVIDGVRYDTTRDVFLAVRTGDRVRAEIGAGSKTVMRVEPIR